MSKWDDSGCSDCDGSVVIPVGEKGDNGSSTGTVVSGTSATLALSASQSGSTIVFDRATGVSTTLPPAPPIGTNFDFIVTTAVTSGGYNISTGTTADTFNGAVFAMKSGDYPTIMVPSALGVSSMNMNGSTTGGLVGTSFSLEYTSSGKWTATGVTYGSGTLATPFA